MIIDGMKLHHIGYVVDNCTVAAKTYCNIFCEREIYTENVKSQVVNIALVKEGETWIEFIEPASPDSPVYEFACRGGGFHHLCYEVDDINSYIEQLKSDWKVIVPPVIGFMGRWTCFLFAKNNNQTNSLIELVQR